LFRPNYIAVKSSCHGGSPAYFIYIYIYKGKGKVYPITGHEGLEEE